MAAWRKEDPCAFTCGVPRDFHLQQILLEKKGREIKQDLPRLQSRQPTYHTLTKHRSNVEAYVFRNRYKGFHKQMKHLVRSLNIYTQQLKSLNKMTKLYHKVDTNPSSKLHMIHCMHNSSNTSYLLLSRILQLPRQMNPILDGKGDRKPKPQPTKTLTLKRLMVVTSVRDSFTLCHQRSPSDKEKSKRRINPERKDLREITRSDS